MRLKSVPWFTDSDHKWGLDTWRRKVVAHLYTQGSVLEYEPRIGYLIDHIFVEQLDKFAQTGEAFDISQWFLKYSTPWVRRMLFEFLTLYQIHL